MAQPKTKTSQLIDEINRATANSDLSEFKVATLKKQIADLRKVAAQEANVIEGILETQLGNYDSMHAAYSKALKINPFDWFTVFNYGVSLDRTADWTTALTYAQKARECATRPEDLTDAIALIESVLQKLMRFNELQRTYDSNYEYVVRVMDAKGIKDEDLSIFPEMLSSILRERRAIDYDHFVQLLTEEDENIYVGVKLNCSAQDAAEINDLIAARLAELEIPPNVDSTFTMGVLMGGSDRG